MVCTCPEFLKSLKLVTRVDLTLGNLVFCMGNKVILDMIGIFLEFLTPESNKKIKILLAIFLV